MTPVRFAVIADVHGNVFALDAVLADIARRGVQRIVNLGDNANGPIDPAQSVARLRESGAIHVRGNGDRMTAGSDDRVRGSAQFARERLTEDARTWLGSLPMSVRKDDWVAFHAAPSDDECYVMENVVGGCTVLASAVEIAHRIGPSSGESLVLCGHTHFPRLVRLADRRVVLNPGSVGLPAYTDNEPSVHAVENGTPHARYAIVSRDSVDAEWRVEFVALAYDWEAAASTARAFGWADWARHVGTGYR